jgi:hypothetical protein
LGSDFIVGLTLPHGLRPAGPGIYELDVDAKLSPLPLYCIWRRSSDVATYETSADLARPAQNLISARPSAA